jgi:endonuclease-3
VSQRPLNVGYVIRELEKLYDPPQSFLFWKTPLDLVVATILSAQCTDARVNTITPSLFRQCRTPADYVALSQKELERVIHSCGTFRVKAKHIRQLCKLLIERHNGKVPQTLAELTALPGIGKKTASIILYAAFGLQGGIAVDTHVMRLARRMGLTRQKNPDKIALELEQQVPRKQWGRLNTLFISHGRTVCTARNRKCAEGVFQNRCPSSKEQNRKDLAKD